MKIIRLLRSKKAQTMLFVILGIAVLVMASLSYYIYSKRGKVLGVEGRIGEVSEGLPELRILVEGCIEQLGTEALREMGKHGGYISLEDPTYTQGRMFEIGSTPTSSDAIEFSQGSEQYIPYWWYMKGQEVCTGDCPITSNNIPSMERVELQLNDYIKNNLLECVDYFKPLKQQGYKVIIGKIRPSVEITEEDVVFFVNFPIELEKPDIKFSDREFKVVLDVRFKYIYALAASVALTQKYTQVLETALMSIISSHSGLESNKLPPISQIDHSNSVMKWHESMVREDMKNLILSYTPLLQVNGTKNFKLINVSDQAIGGIYNSMMFNIDPFLPAYSDFEAYFYFLDWPIFFDITPQVEGLLEPSIETTEFIGGFLDNHYTNNYQFYYDVSYPLVVEVRDKSAFNNAGYSFMFAMEANVRDNKDLQKWARGEGTYGFVEPQNVQIETSIQPNVHGDCTPDDDKWKCSIDNRRYSTQLVCAERCKSSDVIVETGNLDPQLFCDPLQELSGPVNITTKSTRRDEPLAGVTVTYRCGDYSGCKKGVTEFMNATKAMFTGKFPVCVGGFLELKKEGYQTESIPLDSEFDKPITLDVEMQPFYYYDIELQKIRLYDPIPFKYFSMRESTRGDMLTEFIDISTINSTRITTDEQVMINIEKVKDTPYEPTILNTFMYDGDSREFTPDSKLKLIPGLYKVSMQIMGTDGLNITPKCQSACTKEILVPDTSGMGLLGSYMSCVEYMNLPEEEITMDTYLIGGLELGGGTGFVNLTVPNSTANLSTSNPYWNVTQEDLDAGHDSVLFTLVRPPNPTCLQSVPVYEQQKTSYERNYHGALREKCNLRPPLKCISMEEMARTEYYVLLNRSIFEPDFR